MTDPVAVGVALTKRFRDGSGRRTVLDSVDIDVSPGQITAVVGRSGCGKTTLLRILSGMLAPDSGTVRLMGQQVPYGRSSAVAKMRRRHVGLMTPSAPLIDDESIRANVGLPLLLDRTVPSTTRNLAVTRALTSVGLDLNPRTRVAKLSSGERQRVALARAIVSRPTLLTADEPTAALDAEASRQAIGLLRTIADSGVAVVTATHDPVVTAAADAVWRFDGPHLGRAGSPRGSR